MANCTNYSSDEYKKRRIQANRLRMRREGWVWSAYILGGGEARWVGGEGALDECSKHLNCSGVITGGHEVQGFGKGPSGVLTCGAAEQGVFSDLDLLLTPWAEPRVM